MVNDKVVQEAGSGKILSIVIPTYNMEKYLPVCLDSVTDELVSDRLEVIVVNDGSTLFLSRQPPLSRVEPDVSETLHIV